MSEKSEIKTSSIDRTSSALIINPQKEIDNASEKGDWVSAFSIAVSYFEHYGAEIIKKRCEPLGIRGYDEIVDRMTVSNMILTLRLLEIVDGETYSKLKMIEVERNKLVHPGRGGIGYKYTKQEKRAKEILADAKACITVLQKRLGEN